MRIEKVQIVMKRILEETSLESVTITGNGKPTQYQIELGDYITERDYIKLGTIRAEEEVHRIAIYRDTGLVLS